jgi:hypothetical protein
MEPTTIAEAVTIASNYPLVRCSTHPGATRPGYLVCAHVSRGADIGAHVDPGADHIGLIVCGQCMIATASGDAIKLLRLSDILLLSCAQCVAYHLAAPLKRFAERQPS